MSKNSTTDKKSVPFPLEELSLLNNQDTIPLSDKLMHELKNPIHGISALSEHIVENWDSMDIAIIKDCMKDILNASKNAVEIVKIMSQVDIPKDLTLVFEDKEIVKLTTEILKHIKNLYLNNKDITINMDSAIDEAILSIDSKWYQRLLFNLISNAVHYAKKGNITVSIRRANVNDQEHCLVSVQDEGDGIPESELENIFKPFERSKPANENDGTNQGLGLAICKEILREHNGVINATNNLGDTKGAIIKCFFPLKQDSK